MTRLFDDRTTRAWRVLPANDQYRRTFPVEVSETDTEIEVKAELPGVDPDAVEVTVQDDVLTIKAEHKDASEDKQRDYYRREIRYGALHRSMALPSGVDADKAEASFENGVLNLRLPKAESLRPKRIEVAKTAA